MKHPMQPVETDKRGVYRFKKNAIVDFLLEKGGIDLNRIALLDFPKEDREQFAQLIGYSLSGASDLSYMSNEVIESAYLMHEKGLSEDQARIEYLQATLSKVKAGIKEVASELFNKHPDDFEEE